MSEHAEIYAMIDHLGDVGLAMNEARPSRLQELYDAIGLEALYDAEERAVEVTLNLTGRGSARVRGGLAQ